MIDEMKVIRFVWGSKRGDSELKVSAMMAQVLWSNSVSQSFSVSFQDGGSYPFLMYRSMGYPANDLYTSPSMPNISLGRPPSSSVSGCQEFYHSFLLFMNKNLFLTGFQRLGLLIWKMFENHEKVNSDLCLITTYRFILAAV